MPRLAPVTNARFPSSENSPSIIPRCCKLSGQPGKESLPAFLWRLLIHFRGGSFQDFVAYSLRLLWRCRSIAVAIAQYCAHA
jgi:hypothetical protein